MDPILFWHKAALEANRISHTTTSATPSDMATLGPVLSARALAIVHLAMYDALAKTDPAAGLTTYLPNYPAVPAGAQPAAAIAGAAYATLVVLHPSQRNFFDRQLHEMGLTGPGVREGLEYGRGVGTRLLAHRADDPIKSEDIFIPSTGGRYVAGFGRGRHRVDPDNPGQGFYAPFYGAKADLFASQTRYQLNAPPQPGTAAYDAALAEVRVKGIKPELAGLLPAGSPLRTPTESLIGLYWAYDGAFEIGTPPRLYNQIIAKVAEAQGLTTAEYARLFALVNAAMADAGTLAWEQKYRHDFWRPVLGVREHGPSMGPDGQATAGENNLTLDSDPTWLPLGAPRSNALGMKNFTPNFPAYPSGHATFGAAAFHMARLFFSNGALIGNYAPDTLLNGLTFVSDELNGVNRDGTVSSDIPGTVRPRHERQFPDGFWGMIQENAESRVLLGVHWLFDAFVKDGNGDPDLGQEIGGLPLGVRIAEDIWTNGSGPNGQKGPAEPAAMGASNVITALSIGPAAPLKATSRRAAAATAGAAAGSKTIVARVKTRAPISVAFIATHVDPSGQDLTGGAQDQTADFTTDNSGRLIWALNLVTQNPHVFWELFLTEQGQAEGAAVDSGTTNGNGLAFDPAHPNRVPSGEQNF
ncbi:MAG: hypothetical protein V4671_01265 [Armatimonadota bacterium]